MKPRFTVIIEKEDDMYVGLCPELDIASQGNTIEETKQNLSEAVELFFEYASPDEVKSRLNYDVFISSLEVNLGKAEEVIG